MKKVINGKMYNTETAEEIHNYCNGLGAGDFRNVDETLYKTKKGAFFLAGEGGAMTKYSRSCGSNSVCGGDNIFALTEAEALEWCETHDADPENIAEHFSVEEA